MKHIGKFLQKATFLYHFIAGIECFLPVHEKSLSAFFQPTILQLQPVCFIDQNIQSFAQVYHFRIQDIPACQKFIQPSLKQLYSYF
jgi:hypothetical protein